VLLIDITCSIYDLVLRSHCSDMQEAVTSKGLCDDTTCIVVNILPPEKLSPPIKKHGKGGIIHLFCRKSSDEMSENQMDRGCLEPDVVKEIYEEGSAMLARRSALILVCWIHLIHTN
jgi:hypothetical protein